MTKTTTKYGIANYHHTFSQLKNNFKLEDSPLVAPDGATLAGTVETSHKGRGLTPCVTSLLLALTTISVITTTLTTYQMFEIGNESHDFKIAVGGDFPPQEFLLSNGSVVGFHLDLIEMVCKEAGIYCATTFEPYTNCWDTIAGEEPRGGMGLFDNWYDGCMGWTDTVERQRVFAFSKPFTRARRSYFFANTADRQHEIKNFKIGFIDGWSSDVHCLKRNGVHINEEAQDYSKTSDRIAEKITSQQINRAFVVDGILNSTKFKKILPGFDCDQTGSSMMTLKRSKFLKLWNKGFDALMSRKKSSYYHLCSKWHMMSSCS